MSYNIKSFKKNQDNSRLTFWFIIGFFILALSVNLIKLTREYVVKRSILKDNRRELLELSKAKNELELKIEKGKSREYIEAEARKLALAKPNEVVIILTSPTPKPTPKLSPTPYISNYKLWFKTLFEDDRDH